MDLDALIRSICLRDRHYAFFFGAGTSITSGIPSAWECIWQWKLSLFLTQNSHINSKLLGPCTLPHVQKIVQKWLDDQKSYPPINSDFEYGRYAEKCFPQAPDRQQWFKGLVSKSNPHIGYKLLGLLAELGKIKWIWTPNFDDLVERGRPSDRRRSFLQIGQDSSKRLENIRFESEDIVQVFLHGDYRYDSLSNTEQELKALNAGLLKYFVSSLSEFPLVVMGYSGRDDSIMNALSEAYRNKNKGGLFWCNMENAPLSEKVTALIKTAKDAGNVAEIITFEGFDDFMIRLARYWLKDSPEFIAVDNLLKAVPVKNNFSITHLHPDFGWNLGNSYEIELPKELLHFSVNCLPAEGAYKKLRELIGDLPISAGLFKGKVLALGNLADIQHVFSKHLTSKIEPLPISNENAVLSNTVVYEIILKSLVNALENRGLKRVGKYILATSKILTHNGEKYQESVELSLDSVNGKIYLSTLPDVYFLNANLSKEAHQSLKRDVLWRQRNSQYFEAVKTWKDLLFANNNNWRVGYPTTKPAYYFAVNPDGPVCSRIYSSNPQSSSKEIVQKFSRFEKFKGFKIQEPYLQFRSSKSIHPIKGLTDCGGPVEIYDKAYHHSSNIRLGVICLEGHDAIFRSFLNSLKQGISSQGNFDEDYLVDFPGFENAFKCGLTVPSTNTDPKWKTIPRINIDDAIRMNKELMAVITEKIKELQASGDIDVVTIYVPTEWGKCEKIVTETFRLDLHDQIKAICVERGIRTQLIREKKVRSENNCRLRWWLSLALFTKSMRVPWVIDSPDNQVAYVGLGYSLDQIQSEKNHIVLGCSHVFDSNGLGMRFRLSRLKNPIWKQDFLTRRKNPYMSEDDAYQLGNRTRQLFYEAHQSLPRRVLICKRSHFLDSEIKGILAALNGIAHVDLLTIEQENSWRFCAYNTYKQAADGFPIERGSGIILDEKSLLLWLHGNVKNLNQNKSYFQGKSRIPVPVRVTRYAGDTPVQTLAQDLLALTKMDWNTFALYKQMPVSVTTPTSIARIGQLLHTLSAESYDYRLFM